MKIYSFLLVISSFLFNQRYAYSQEKIYLDPCLKLCLILYTDNSGSMDSAISDTHRRARSMTLVPSETGYVEIGLYSFGEYYEEWTAPTGNRAILMQAIDSLCKKSTESKTLPHYGLRYLNQLLKERRNKDSTERQVVLIHTDYGWQDTDDAVKEIKELIEGGVIVILSLPMAYDKKDIVGRRDIDEENLNSILDQTKAINIRSDFELFKNILKKLRAIKPCG